MKLDDRIDLMFKLREQKRALEAQAKQLGKELDEHERQLIAAYKAVGTVTARGTLASATITETIIPTIDDWGLVEGWILENDALYLLHRRVSSAPWKELRDAGTDVPGIEPFTKQAISLRKRGD